MRNSTEKLAIALLFALMFVLPCFGGERLYNGIVLPDVWPPEHMNPHCYAPMPVPYLEHIPDT